MMENYAHIIYLSGLGVIVLGCVGLVIRAFRHWRKGLLPLGMIALGLAITAFPSAYTLLAPIDLGPRDELVDGERHLTLTGWDRKDYGFLASKPDTVVLQMANPDVTDQTLDLFERDEDSQGAGPQRHPGDRCGPAGAQRPARAEVFAAQEYQDHQSGISRYTGTERVSHAARADRNTGRRETVQAWQSARSGRRALR